MNTTRQVHDYLKGKRNLDLDTMISTIEVDCDYDSFVESVAIALGIDADECLEAFQVLEAHDRIILMPQMEPYIEYIEVYD